LPIKAKHTEAKRHGGEKLSKLSILKQRNMVEKSYQSEKHNAEAALIPYIKF
jgi:hypothetical protein